MTDSFLPSCFLYPKLLLFWEIRIVPFGWPFRVDFWKYGDYIPNKTMVIWHSNLTVNAWGVQSQVLEAPARWPCIYQISLGVPGMFLLWGESGDCDDSLMLLVFSNQRNVMLCKFFKSPSSVFSLPAINCWLSLWMLGMAWDMLKGEGDVH